MEGKPFAVIETDGHSGDAGTKTRVEAFLHCVREDRQGARREARPTDFRDVELARIRLEGHSERGETAAGPAAWAAWPKWPPRVSGGSGVRAECLPEPDTDALRFGRRQTSGKECLPMCLTLGSLLQRVDQARDPSERFALLMPGAPGPCRFGIYNLLNRSRSNAWAEGSRPHLVAE